MSNSPDSENESNFYSIRTNLAVARGNRLFMAACRRLSRELGGLLGRSCARPIPQDVGDVPQPLSAWASYREPKKTAIHGKPIPAVVTAREPAILADGVPLEKGPGRESTRKKWPRVWAWRPDRSAGRWEKRASLAARAQRSKLRPTNADRRRLVATHVRFDQDVTAGPGGVSPGRPKAFLRLQATAS